MSDLPQNLQAERGLLGIILLNNEVIHEIGDLSKDDFAESYNGELFILFRDLIEQSRRITAITVLHDAQDSVIWGELKASDYLAKLEAEAPVTDQARYAISFAATIRDSALSSRTLTTIGALAERIRAAPASIPSVVLRDMVEESLTDLFRSSTDLGLNDVAVIGDRILNHLKDSTQEVGRRVGLSFVENLTGPLLPGRLMMLGGPSGSGKSGLLAQIARYDAERGGTPLLFTREMPDEEVVARILSGETGISGENIERNNLSREEYEALFNANEKLRHLTFKITSPRKFSVPFIRARALRQQSLSGLTMIEVDHVHLLAKSDKRMGESEATNENLEGLKAMSMELGVPVIAACQLTGEALKDINRWPHRSPIFTDLLYSSAIDRNADIVLIVFRQEHVLKRNRPRREDDPGKYSEWEAKLLGVEGKVEAILTKRRGGRGEGYQVGYFDSSRVLFADKPFRTAWVPPPGQML